MRGRRHIHVLCKHEQVVSVRKALEVVYEEDSVDLAILTFTSQHMLPWLDRFDASIPGWDPDLFPLEIPEATCFLVNRHASRPGDDVVIWSLLAGSKPFFDIKSFWREASRHFLEFRIGHLMSDLPRLEHVPGLRWAPSQPRLANSIRRFQSTTSDGGSPYVDTHHEQIYDGIGSRYGQIVPGGAFQAVWCVHEFTAPPYLENNNPDTTDKGILERKEILSDVARQFMVSGQRSCLLRPASHDFPQDENQTILYRGNGGGPLVAVVSHHRRYAWKWEGLYEWPLEIELPIFNHRNMWIV